MDVSFFRRIASTLISLATLWTVGVTAGSENAVSAIQALRESVSLTALRSDAETFPAALALSQAPLLYSARDNAQFFPEEEAPSGNAESGDAAPRPDTSNVAPSDGDSAPEAVSDEESATPDDGASGDGGTSGKPDASDAGGDSPQPSDVARSGNASDADADTRKAIPLQEAAQEPIPQTDNGVRARTLIPKGPDGYTVCGRVYISSSRKAPLNVAELREPFDAELTGESPQILILHSHGSEAYTPAPGTNLVWWGDSRTTDFRYSVVRVGDEMASSTTARSTITPTTANPMTVRYRRLKVIWRSIRPFISFWTFIGIISPIPAGIRTKSFRRLTA